MERLRRAGSDERAFTLVELMVVVMIVGVLVAMAIPTFTAARHTAQDSAAKAALRTASKAAWVYEVERNRFADSGAARAELEAIEGSVEWLAGESATTSGNQVSVAEGADGRELALAARSVAGRCFYLRISSATEEFRHADDVVECRADDYVEGPNTGW